MPVTESFSTRCVVALTLEDSTAMLLSCPVLTWLEVSLRFLAKRNGKCLFQTDAMFILLI